MTTGSTDQASYPIEHWEGAGKYIADLLNQVLDLSGKNSDQDAQDQWVAYVNDVASFTLFPTCGSWYLGANVPGKPRVFMPLPGFPGYAQQVSDVVADDYRGFTMS